MEEFEKWWKKTSCEGDWDYEKYAKLGWQEALQWVLDLVPDIETYDEIKAELEE